MDRIVTLALEEEYWEIIFRILKRNKRLSMEEHTLVKDLWAQFVDDEQTYYEFVEED
jgi:hypothetical protein